MKLLPCQPLLRCSVLSLATLAGSPAATADTALPAWQVLEYEQQAFFVTASSRIELIAKSDNSANWHLEASSSVASNSEQVTMEMAAADGRAINRSRLSKGKNERYKVVEFLPEHLVRVRRTAPDNTSLAPPQWPVNSRKEIPYPPLAAGVVVTDAYALLELAGRFQASQQTSAEVVVNTDRNFYRVRMSHGENPPAIQVKYQVTAASPVSGKRQTRAVLLQVSPAGEQPEKPDFSLLGLNGDATILFDASSGLPLQLRGKAPRIGNTEINLKSVTLREPAA